MLLLMDIIVVFTEQDGNAQFAQCPALNETSVYWNFYHSNTVAFTM